MASAGLRYYIGNHIMVQSLRENGYTKALALVKNYLQAQGIALFKANKEGVYELYVEEELAKNNMLFVGSIINSASDLIEKKILSI